VRLWTDEIERMRPEARAVVGAGLAAIAEAFAGQGEPPADLHERALHSRAMFARTFGESDPSAVDVELGGVRCRSFRPEGEARAVYLHFHGGGMILGAPEMNDVGNRAIADAHGVAVVSVDYRLAPEHPYPAGPDDGVAVARWLLEHAASEYGTDRIVIGGESAGGYMAAAVLLRLRDVPGALERVLGVNLVFGVFDWGRSPSQRGVRPVEGPDMLTPEGIVTFVDCYLPDRTDDERRAPEVSPAFADLRGLPPALVSVGTADHLLDDSLMLAGRYLAAGNELELFVAPDMPHGFQAFPCGITQAWGDAVAAWIEARLSG
jgi:acetyl esterase